MREWFRVARIKADRTSSGILSFMARHAHSQGRGKKKKKKKKKKSRTDGILERRKHPLIGDEWK